MNETILETIDSNMRDIILELNRKGYETMFSCGGHLGVEYTEIYVVIKRNPTLDIILESIDTSIFSCLPEGFIVEIQDGDDTYNTLKKFANPEWVEQFEPDFFHRFTIRTSSEVSEMMFNNQEVIDTKIKDLRDFIKILPSL